MPLAQWGVMISQTRQRFAMGGMVAVAILAIVVGAVYQDDNRLDEPRIVGAETSADSSQPAQDNAVTQAINPIEGFLPESGEASACSEPIGVDLGPGFGARLTINGVPIAPEDMNVNLTEAGEVSNVVTATRSLGQYTFEADDNCPNGSLLRPVGNVLEVCVFRLSDTSQTCTLVRENIFDAL